MPKTEYAIRSLESAFKVLDCFSQSDGEALSFANICEMTKFNKNRVFRLLNTLTKHSYLQKDPKTKVYRLGPALLILGELYRRQNDLRRLSLPYIKELADKSGDASHIVVLHEDKYICLANAVGKHNLQSVMNVGETFPLHIGASSKFLLLSLPEEERATLIAKLEYEQYTDNTLADPVSLKKELLVAQSQGYYVVQDDYEIGTNSIAAPVKDFSGNIIAALALVIPSVRFSRQHKKDMIGLVVEVAQEFSRTLGYKSE